MTAHMALQLNNIDLDEAADDPDPRANLISQLQRVDACGNYHVTIDKVGTRDGPGCLYQTSMFDSPSAPDVRNKLINSARTGLPWDISKLPNPTAYLPSTTTASAPTTTPKSISQPSPTASTQDITTHPDVKPGLQPTPTTNAQQATTIPSAPTTPDHASAWVSSTTTEKALIELRHIHCALGHPSDEVLLQSLKDSGSPHDLRLRKYVKLMDTCNVCPMGTQRAESHPSSATTRSTKYLARLIMDCSGRQPVASVGGFWYFLLIVDDATRYKWVELLKSITQVAAVFDNFLRTVVRQGTAGAAGTVRCVQLVRTDNGPDFNCDAFRQVLRRHSITHEPSPPDASQQRGIAERGIGVLSAITRAGLFWAKAPLSFWGECIKHHATPTSNNRPNSANTNNASPYKMINPDRPSQLRKLRPFGCLSFTLVKTMDRQGKLNPASSCGFLSGYGVTPDGTINGYRVMNLRTHRFTTKCNVKFNVQLPALRYALSALVHSPQRMLIGRTIRKQFTQGTFTGKITGVDTVDNVTLYDIKYSDGDAEQMEILEVLQYIAPVQHDMTPTRPNMHKRLRQSTPHDRARLGKDLLPDPTIPTTTTIQPTPTPTPTAPTSTVLLRKSTRKKKTPNRLTSTKPGSTVDSAQLPLLHKTHTANKASPARLIPNRAKAKWKSAHAGKATTLLMVSMLVNAVTSVNTCPPPNAIINGIHVHRYCTDSPSLPKVPARDIPLPSNYDDAVNGKYSMFWRPAIQKEIDSLFRYGVWRLEPLPRNALVLPCKFVFKVKPDGNDPPGISKFKCRYCGKGFLQKKGIHFQCTYAPCASATSSRITVAMATEMGWPLHGMDVSNAYLNGDLHSDTVLFVKAPPTVRVPPGYGLRLCKGLYGTMQGGNRWAIHKHLKLTELGYDRNASEPSLYHRCDRFGIVIMTIIVDDFQITGWPPAAVARAKHQLSQTWDMTDLGPLRYFASVEVNRDAEQRTTTLKQTGYIQDILSRYNMPDCYGKPTPCTPSIYKQQLLDPVSEYAPMFDNDYRSQVGSLGYLRRTRPDLCVSLGITAQFSKLGRHGPQHYRGLRNIMRYIKLTMRHGLLYTSTRKGFRDPWDLSAHVDSDWATWKGSRRSRTGYLIYLNQCLISFGSKLQSAVATSSAEAEYMALSYVTKLLLWILQMIEGIPSQFVRRPIRVFEDNKPCINLANNHAASKFTRHIGICHHFLRDHFDSGSRQFKLFWTSSSDQKADGMTKPLPRGDFISFRDQVVSDHTC